MCCRSFILEVLYSSVVQLTTTFLWSYATTTRKLTLSALGPRAVRCALRQHWRTACFGFFGLVTRTRVWQVFATHSMLVCFGFSVVVVDFSRYHPSSVCPGDIMFIHIREEKWCGVVPIERLWWRRTTIKWVIFYYDDDDDGNGGNTGNTNDVWM